MTTPTSDEFAEEFGEKPVMRSEREAIVIGGVSYAMEHPFRVGDTVQLPNGLSGPVTNLSGTRFVKVGDVPGYHNCESLTLVDTTNRRYTLTEAIDKIVDGLRLEWRNISVRHLDSMVCIGSDAVTPVGTYEVRCGAMRYAALRVRGEFIRMENPTQESCLADYRTRFRAEIERAVKS